MMTPYEELRELGLPEIPAPYRLKFSIVKKTQDTRNKTYYNVLHVKIQKKTLGFFYRTVQGCFMPQSDMNDPYEEFNRQLINEGLFTEEHFRNATSWEPFHLVSIGRFAYHHHLRDKALNAPKDTSKIDYFLNKGMP
jgi:hypothetical protein